MTVTIGGRGVVSPSSGAVPRAAVSWSASLTAVSSTSQPNSAATIFAVSASSVVLMFTPVMPRRMSFIKTSVALSCMRAESVCRLTDSSMRTTFLWAPRSCVITGPFGRAIIGAPNGRRMPGRLKPGRP
jgi:hypothetical protein